MLLSVYIVVTTLNQKPRCRDLTSVIVLQTCIGIQYLFSPEFMVQLSYLLSIGKRIVNVVPDPGIDVTSISP